MAAGCWHVPVLHPISVLVRGTSHSQEVAQGEGRRHRIFASHRDHKRASWRGVMWLLKGTRGFLMHTVADWKGRRTRQQKMQRSSCHLPFQIPQGRAEALLERWKGFRVPWKSMFASVEERHRGGDDGRVGVLLACGGESGDGKDISLLSCWAGKRYSMQLRQLIVTGSDAWGCEASGQCTAYSTHCIALQRVGRHTRSCKGY